MRSPEHLPLAPGAGAAGASTQGSALSFRPLCPPADALESALRLLEPDEKLRLLKTKDLELLSLMSDAGSSFTPATLNDQNLIQRTLKPLVQSLGIQNLFSCARPFQLLRADDRIAGPAGQRCHTTGDRARGTGFHEGAAGDFRSERSPHRSP